MSKREGAQSTTRDSLTQHSCDGERADDEDSGFYLSLLRSDLTDEEVRRLWRNAR